MKMTSYAIFQYNVLAIYDTHNTWTNVIVKMTILRLLGSSDDKEKRGVARIDDKDDYSQAFCIYTWTNVIVKGQGLRHFAIIG